jgi:uncharacterized repeat protein (TIGR02543 family)
MNISGWAKNKKFVSLVSIAALLGAVFSTSAQADDDRNKKDDRSKRVIELANPSGVVITPSSTSLSITFNRVPNASSYTVRVFQGTSGDRLVGQPRTMFNPGNSVTGLTPSTDYRVSVQAIGDKTRYSNSDDPRKFRTRTTGNVITSYVVDWGPACAGNPPNCTEATGGMRSYTPGQQLVPPTTPVFTGFRFLGWESSNIAVAPTSTSTPVAPFGNLTFRPQWIAIDYAVTWNTNCPVQTPRACTDVIDGSSTYLLTNLINAPSTAPTIPGWTFAGWSSNNANVSSTSFPTRAVSPYGNVEFTAEWTPITFQLIWNSNCGNVYNCQPTTGGATTFLAGTAIENVELPTNPSKPGSTFIAWDAVNLDINFVNSTITVTALWDLDPSFDTYTIILNSDCLDNSVCTPATPAVTIFRYPPGFQDDGAEQRAWFETVSVPVEPGRTFVGWDFEMLSEDGLTLTFKALWETPPPSGPRTWNIYWEPGCPGPCSLVGGGPTFYVSNNPNLFLGVTTYVEGETIGYVPTPDPMFFSGTGFNGWNALNTDHIPDPDYRPSAPYGDLYFIANQWSTP